MVLTLELCLMQRHLLFSDLDSVCLGDWYPRISHSFSSMALLYCTSPYSDPQKSGLKCCVTLAICTSRFSVSDARL